MKRSYSLSSVLVSVVAAICLLTGCSGDKGNPIGSEPGSIVGTWDLTDITSKAPNGPVYHVPPEEIAADPLTYTFRADSTAVQYYQDKETGFGWLLDGSTLTTYAPYETNVYQCSVTKTTLRLAFSEDIFTITHIFTRQ